MKKILVLAFLGLSLAGCETAAGRGPAVYGGGAYAGGGLSGGPRENCNGRRVVLSSGRVWCVTRETDPEIMRQPEYGRRRSEICGGNTGMVQVRLGHGQVAGYNCGSRVR